MNLKVLWTIMKLPPGVGLSSEALEPLINIFAETLLNVPVINGWFKFVYVIK